MFRIQFAKGVDRESIALSAHPGFLEIIARSREEFRRGETLSLAEMRAAFGETAARGPRRMAAKPRPKPINHR